jgi:hypothetical protein
VALATSSARATFPGYERAHRFAGDAAGDLDIFTVNPDSWEPCTSPAITPMTLAEYENVARPAARYLAYRNPLLMLFVGRPSSSCASAGSPGAA